MGLGGVIYYPPLAKGEAKGICKGLFRAAFRGCQGKKLIFQDLTPLTFLVLMPANTRKRSLSLFCLTLDVAEALVNDIDEIREEIGVEIGVDRGALIKVWLHERVKQEKAAHGAQL